MKPNAQACGKPAALFLRPWHAKPPTSLAKISPSRAAPSRRRSSASKEVSAKYGLPIVIFGHAGDGNLHPNILFDKRDPEQWAKVEKMVAEEFAIALELGWNPFGRTWRGHPQTPLHGTRLGTVSIGIQKQIKHVFDPFNILNPGKVLPD